MFRITVIPLRDRQICWQLILTVGIRNCHPIRRHENYRLSSSNLFRFSLERTFRIFCFVFISIIGVSVSQWNESIYVNGVERLGCRTLRKIQISFRLFIFLLFIDISLLIPSRPFARSYLWSVPLSEFREEFENWKFFFYIKLIHPTSLNIVGKIHSLVIKCIRNIEKSIIFHKLLQPRN